MGGLLQPNPQEQVWHPHQILSEALWEDRAHGVPDLVPFTDEATAVSPRVGCPDGFTVGRCIQYRRVALALLVYSLTGSGLGVSGVVIAEIIPVLLLASFAGPLVDCLPRVAVMIAADLIRAALAFSLPFLDGSVFAVYAVAFGLSAGAVFFNPAAQSVLPSLVRERDLVVANSGLWTAAVVPQVVFAPLAGVVVAAYGYDWAFWINGSPRLDIAYRLETGQASPQPIVATTSAPRARSSMSTHQPLSATGVTFG